MSRRRRPRTTAWRWRRSRRARTDRGEAGTAKLSELEALTDRARSWRAVIEDYNYSSIAAPRDPRAHRTGEFRGGHARRRMICLDILDRTVRDPNSPHPPSRSTRAIADFRPILLPWRTSSSARIAGRMQSGQAKNRLLPTTSSRPGGSERGTATVRSALARTRMLSAARVRERHAATANLFETRITFDRSVPGPKPLQPLLNGLEKQGHPQAAVATRRASSGAPRRVRRNVRALRSSYRARAVLRRCPSAPRQSWR